MNTNTLAARPLHDPRLERCEVAAWGDLYRAAPPTVVDACGLQISPILGGVLTAASAIDVLALNRVVGIGLDHAVDRRDIQRMVELFRSAGTRRFFVQISPDADGRETREALAAHGFRLHNRWVKLHRKSEPPPRTETRLRIECIGRAQAESFARVLTAGFDWPSSAGPWIDATIGRPGWRHYLAYEDDIPVATGAIFVDDAWAWLDMASTLPEHRGKGAQSGLLARRIRDAAALGCTDLVVETAESRPGKPSASYRNVRRFGFEVAYLRANYLWEERR